MAWADLVEWAYKETLTLCAKEVALEVWAWEAAWAALEEWECKEHQFNKRKNLSRFSYQARNAVSIQTCILWLPKEMKMSPAKMLLCSLVNLDFQWIK